MVKSKKESIFEKIKKLYANNKLAVILFAVILLLVFIFYGAKIVLYLNFILGNDIIVTLSTPNENFHLLNGEVTNITFTPKVKTNPFCKAYCIAYFEDISKNNIQRRDEFILSTTSPITLTYTLNADKIGVGQKLYRQNLECKSLESTLCHTTGNYTSRSILITLDHKLNKEEEQLKLESNLTLNEIKNNLENIYSMLNFINDSINNFQNILILDSEKNHFNSLFGAAEKEKNNLLKLQDLWHDEDYSKLRKESSLAKSESNTLLINTNEFYSDIVSDINEYNFLLVKINETSVMLDNISKILIENDELVKDANSKILEFNSLLYFFNQKTKLEDKKSLVNSLYNSTLIIYNQFLLSSEVDAINKTLELNIDYELLCRLNSTCIKSQKINEKTIEENITLPKVCTKIAELNKIFLSINKEINATQIDYNSSLKQSFYYMKNEVINLYLSNISNDSKKGIIKELLNEKLVLEITNVTFDDNINQTLILEFLTKNLLVECNLIFANSSIEQDININKIEMPEKINYSSDITFETPLRKCCIKSVCTACCENNLCKNEDYPIVFLHGHSFNKRLETEYSLDAFNKIQSKLEGDGYINAGAISMYTASDESYGVWGETSSPLSIKASYYYDLFKEQESYVLVQTKSENIDTYALRLNDIIKSVQYRTQKDKVIIISHSMGGLVARRYIQIFGGKSVDKLIMIGTPNHGITGSILNYCSLVGEKLECNDMKSDSLFLNKLNRDKIPNEPKFYEIIGVGCDTDGVDGDGVVTMDSATLIDAENIKINGTCKGLLPLHTELLNIDEYPKVYDEIKRILT